MVKIRPATKLDRKAIEELIQADRHLQQDRRPDWWEFMVLEMDWVVCGCCALKIYGKKMAEIRSVAFSKAWLRKLYAKTLVRKCVNRAKKEEVRQVLVTVGKRDKELFVRLGFRPFNNEKFAMLKVITRSGLIPTASIPGIEIRPATSRDKCGVDALVKQQPRQLIQPESKLFPSMPEFLVAIMDGRVVGCTALTVFRLMQNGNPEMAEIRTVVVDEACRHRGIGPQLVARQVNSAIRLRVWELLAVTARKQWFENLGFSNQRGAEEALFMVLDNDNCAECNGSAPQLARKRVKKEEE